MSRRVRSVMRRGGAAEDDRSGGSVVGQRVRKVDGPVLDTGVDDLDGGHRVVDGVDDIGDRDVGSAQTALQHECGFEFDERLDVVFPFEGGTFVGEDAGQQESVIGLAEAEGFLHDLRDVAELVPDQAVTACDRVLDVDALDGEGGVRVEGGPGLGRCGDRCTVHTCGPQGGRDVVEFGGLHGCPFSGR
ncbi:hypothetical protein ACFSUH_23870 [Rhodococcus jostii]|uniref:hypothetical protein n=1 Tax=Rhodococcus jostii TaxID=132919 RepID=UPI00362F13BC